MSPQDFRVTEYASPDGAIRVYRLGVFWYGQLRTLRGWEPLADHCFTHEEAIGRSLDALRTLPPEEDAEADRYPFDEEDDLPF